MCSCRSVTQICKTNWHTDRHLHPASSQDPPPVYRHKVTNQQRLPVILVNLFQPCEVGFFPHTTEGVFPSSRSNLVQPCDVGKNPTSHSCTRFLLLTGMWRRRRSCCHAMTFILGISPPSSSLHDDNGIVSNSRGKAVILVKNWRHVSYPWCLLSSCWKNSRNRHHCEIDGTNCVRPLISSRSTVRCSGGSSGPELRSREGHASRIGCLRFYERSDSSLCCFDTIVPLKAMRAGWRLGTPQPYFETVWKSGFWVSCR